MKYSCLCIALTLIAVALVNCQLSSAQKSSSGSKDSTSSSKDSNSRNGGATKNQNENESPMSALLDMIYPNFRNFSFAPDSRKTQGKRQREEQEGNREEDVNDVIDYIQQTGQLGIEFAEQVLESLVGLLRNISEARNGTFENSDFFTIREKV